MTVRFVARLAIAIATLVSSAILCWGQSPWAQSPTITAAQEPRTVRPMPKPSFSPPQAVEGAWVSDQEPVESPRQLPNTGPHRAPDSGAWTTDASDSNAGASDEDCDDDGLLGRGGFLAHRCHFNDLWADVQSHRRIWVQADYLSWWAKGNQLPALVTSSPPGTPQAQAGVLPESATTALLFGNERVDLNQRNGGRISFGYWLIDGEFLGVEGQYFALQQQNSLFSASSTFSDGIQPGDQILARPFFNVDPNLLSPRQDAAILAFPDGFLLGNTPGVLDGGVNIHTASNVQSASALLRRLIWIDFTSQRRLDLIGGYRFFRTDDNVTINDNSTFTPSGGIIPPTTFTSQDSFTARNQFHGGEFGLKGQSYYGRLSLELIAKIAFGNNRQSVLINGSNSTTTLGSTTTGVGGLLAQPSNIGLYQRDVFAVLPEANANLRFDLTCNLRATIGYTFLYMNHVQRSGEAIDTTLNPTQIGGTLTGESRPAFVFHDTGFWAHGANAGVEYRW
jgi:hypothetical protein